MVKLIYKGVMREGLAKVTGFQISVRFGQIYDIPEDAAKQFLKGGEWIKYEGKEAEKEVEVKKSKKKKFFKEDD